MPYRTTEVPAELFHKYKGIGVYCTYRHDNIEDGYKLHEFVLDPDQNEYDDSYFDVRKLPSWPYDRNWHHTSEEEMKAFLEQAIDLGEIKLSEE